MVSARILVVDDDPLIRGSLYELLRHRRFDVEMASDGSEAIDHLKRRSVRLVLADWKMPQVDGLSLLSHIKRYHRDTQVVLMTGFGTIPTAVEAMRQGACDYLAKPIQPDELEATIQRVLGQTAPSVERSAGPSGELIGEHPTMRALLETIRLLAPTPSTILLQGESGTGKRVVAQTIHHADPTRSARPLVEVGCGALPETLLESELFGHVRGAFTGAIRDREGRFELADRGTILLDEIDAFSPALQVKLLRVLQDRTFERVGETHTRQVDVRVIAATNQDLERLVRDGKFREDLYYRLNVIMLRVPALRERASDIPLLVDHCLKRTCARIGKPVHGIQPAALQQLLRYHWPGNIRELENVIERAVILSRHAQLGLEDFPEAVRNGSGRSTGWPKDASAPVSTPAAAPQDAEGLKEALTLPERELILRVLAEVRWNRSQAAKRLGLHRSTLYHKMHHLGIHPS